METAVVERRSTAETELDLPTETLGKIIEIIQTILSTNIIVIIEMDEALELLGKISLLLFQH